MTSIIVSSIKKKQIEQLAAEGKRLDGRQLADYRPIQIEEGVIEKAEGSARVKLGKTEILAGIKIGQGEPFSDRPEEGVMTVNAEFVPLASPNFEPGPPKEEAIELARIVDRGIRESKAIDLKKLCLITGKNVFVVFIDVYVLNHDGNLIDASALAALAALLNTKMFKYEVKGEEVKIKPGFVSLPVVDQPIAITLAEIGGKLIADPGIDEESVINSRLTISFDKGGNICAMQKGGLGTLTKQQIVEAVGLAKEKSIELRKLLVKA